MRTFLSDGPGRGRQPGARGGVAARRAAIAPPLADTGHVSACSSSGRRRRSSRVISPLTAKGYYAAQGLNVNLLPGGPTVDNQTVGSDPDGPEFTVAWVPKVLELRDKGQSDLVDIAQVFQRSGTREVSGLRKGHPRDQHHQPDDFKGKKIGVWDFGNTIPASALSGPGA